MIYKTTVEVDIGTYSLVDMSLLTNYLRCKPFNHTVKRIVSIISLRFCKPFHIALEDICSRVRD